MQLVQCWLEFFVSLSIFPHHNSHCDTCQTLAKYILFLLGTFRDTFLWSAWVVCPRNLSAYCIYGQIFISSEVCASIWTLPMALSQMFSFSHFNMDFKFQISWSFVRHLVLGPGPALDAWACSLKPAPYGGMQCSALMQGEGVLSCIS